MTAQPPRPTGAPQPARPIDVDTGFWLWLTALVLLLIGQLADAFTAPTPISRSFVLGVAALLGLTVGTVVASLLFVMRSGYRWARTALTGGGIATIVYTAMNLLGVPREPVAAVIYAVTGIVGSVLIAGGVYLLHRPDSNGYFVR